MTTSPEQDLLKILNDLVLEVGRQVTDDYVGKHGIWEGISTTNYRSIKKAQKLVEAHTQAVVMSAINKFGKITITHLEESGDIEFVIRHTQHAMNRPQDYDLLTPLKDGRDE